MIMMGSSLDQTLNQSLKTAATSSGMVNDEAELSLRDSCSWNELTKWREAGLRYRRSGFKKWQVDHFSTGSQQYLSPHSTKGIVYFRWLVLVVAVVSTAVAIGPSTYELFNNFWQAAEAKAVNLPLLTGVGFLVASPAIGWLARRPLRSLLNRYLGRP